jgi:colanic acid/amylovoran biosynthesis glycosyltransferase
MFQLGHLASDIKKTHDYKGKIVVCIRGYDITGFVQENPKAYEALFKTCDLFMPVCDAFKNILIELGCSKHKIIVHHSGIDTSFFNFIKKDLKRNGVMRIVSAGRYFEKKGFEYAIKAIKQLIGKYPFIRYRIIGDGPLKGKYRKIVQALGLQKYIRIDGSWYEHDEYRKILHESSLFISPSVTASTNDQEGIPNVAKEAMATGIVVISTDHSGIPELVRNNESGFLVPERNSKALAEKIEYVINHYAQCVPLQNAARDIVVREFDNENLNNRLEKILIKLINN